MSGPKGLISQSFPKVSVDVEKKTIELVGELLSQTSDYSRKTGSISVTVKLVRTTARTASVFSKQTAVS